MNPGRPGHEPGHRPLRGIPRSRAFWELKAEQMMNRLFEPEPLLDLEEDPPAIAEPPQANQPQAPAPPPAAPQRPHPQRRPPHTDAAPGTTPAPLRPSMREQPWLLAAGLGGMALVSALVSALYLSQWNRMQQALTQERNLLLLERLRSFGPATPAAAPPPAATPPAPVLPPPAGTAGVSLEGLPPPPPEEPWMQQLSQLPAGRGVPAPAAAPAGPAAATPAPAPLLRVPVSPPLAAAARRPPRPAAAPAGPVPVLVGVVGAPGKAGSAIFQVGATSTSAGVGETISGTSWRLRSAGADSAVIERDGEQRTLAIGNGG